MRPRFVCHQHSHSHSHHTHFQTRSTDVSRRYPAPKMVVLPAEQEPGAGFNQTPLSELSVETRNQLACMLNRKKVLRSEEGYERDWRGIAALAHQRGYVNENANNPIDLVLNSWTEHNPQTANFGYLERFLGIIDRWDVCDDIQENLSKDTRRYHVKREQQEALIRQSPTPTVKCIETNNNNNTMGHSVQILSEDDQKCVQMGHPLPRYNACVLYAEADIEHATEIMRNLESERYNLKLFLRHRDMLMGVPFEHVQLSNFMATRCNHLIVVLTEEFLRSPENTYLVNFTQKIQIENHTRKIIPILYKPDMYIPQTLGIYTHIKYAGDSTLFNFWDKLARSLHDLDVTSIYSPNKIQTPSPTTEEAPLQRVTTPTIRIQINDRDITDMASYKALDQDEDPLVSMSSDTTAPLPELKLKKNKKLLQKLTLNFGNTSRNGTTVKPLRHAHSISAINVCERERTLSASSSNISTTSESKKSSIKWRPKILKKVLFSRSSSKLQTPS